jgi:hypothetical protein
MDRQLAAKPGRGDGKKFDQSPYHRLQGKLNLVEVEGIVFWILSLMNLFVLKMMSCNALSRSGSWPDTPSY